MASNSALDRLGRSLLDDSISVDGSQLLAEMRRTWRDERAWLEHVVRIACQGSSVTVSGRVKNLGTLKEKLVRMNGGLSTIRDIVGVRVVVHGGRVEQLQALLKIADALKKNSMRLIDRIADPRCGYRALHLEIRRDGVRSEVQIRSQLQHEWAEAMERFADKAGRGVRYSDEYDFPELSAELRVTALRCRESLLAWSEAIHRFERTNATDSDFDRIKRVGLRTKSQLEEFDDQLQ